MTLASETTRVSYNGDGATVAFSVTFPFWEEDDLRVIHVDSSGTETVWTRGTEYTVSGGDGSTGTVTVKTTPTDYTPASGEQLVIKSDLDNVQPTSLPGGGAFPSSAVEQRFDQTVRLIQQVVTDIGATLLAPESEASIGRLPTVASRKGKLLSFDETTGDPEAVAAVDLDLSTVTTYMQGLLQDDTAAEARTTLVAAKSGANTDITSLAGLTEGSAPSTGAGEGALYLKDTAGQPELFFREESDGDEVQITSGGSVVGAVSQTASTYTPTVTCGTSGTITLNTSLDTLSYAQTGDLVQVWGRLTVSSVSSPTGRIHMTLPVAPAAGTEGSNTGAVVCWMSGMVSANVSDVVAILSAANSRIEIYLGDGATVQSDSAQQVQSSTDIYINATYMAS